jgi:PPOX class probable F420-dependent enzyme
MSLPAPVRDFLNEKRFAVLATINADGTPQLTVMWYALHDDTIVMNTTLSRVKGQNLLRDPRISLCVEDAYRYVSVSGVARLNDDQEVAQADIRQLAIRYNGLEDGARQADEMFARQQRVSIYLPVSQVIANGF